MAATVRSQSILVGPKQFPELFATYQDIGQRLEMPNLPKLYVVNGNGVVNAFALECNRRYNYVVINAEIAMLLEKSPISSNSCWRMNWRITSCAMCRLWRLVIGVIPSMLAIVGTTTTRAQEYSADRWRWRSARRPRPRFACWPSAPLDRARREPRCVA